MLVAHLDNYAGVLGEEELHDVIVGDVMEIDVHTAVGVGKGHLEQCGDETTGRDVVASHNPTAVDELLHSLEAVSEVLSIGHGGHIATADGAISLKEVQIAGKKRMDIKAFLAGFRDSEAYATTQGTSKAEIAKTRQ